MSSLLGSPKVTINVDDVSKLLAGARSAYDVIISDSFGLVGPVRTFSTESYFQLLYDALTLGGHISIQGGCPWLHLQPISELKALALRLFPVSEYAYTTMPSYPSGQIGFIICSKEAGRDLKKPVRKVKNTTYYSAGLHKSAFELPEFCRAMLEEGKDILPKFGWAATAAALQGRETKKVLLLGSGFVARPCAEYIARNPLNELTIGEDCKLIHVSPRLISTYFKLPAHSRVPRRSHLDCLTREQSLLTSPLFRTLTLRLLLVILSSHLFRLHSMLSLLSLQSKARPTSSPPATSLPKLGNLIAK
jgi:spermidine synthase / saccharopine dehydrogenase (NADP+, L-glutamate-forming)